MKVGEIITDVTAVGEGWCKGKLGSNTGMFPEKFVEFLEVKPQPSASTIKKEIKIKVKVTYGNKPTNEDELRLVAGELIEVYANEQKG